MIGNMNNSPVSFVGGSDMTTGNARNQQMMMTSPNFYDSGENMTQERFIKSRQQAKRNKNLGRSNGFGQPVIA